MRPAFYFTCNLKFNLKRLMDYWREKYLFPVLNTNKSVALVGVGGAESYVENQHLEEWDPYVLSRRCDDYCVYDINEKLVSIACDHGIRAEKLDVTQQTLGRKFDRIFAVDVLEHTFDPISFLKNLRDSLTPDGLLVFTAPNSIYWRQFIKLSEFEEHLFAFNRETLKHLAREINLEIVELNSFQTTGGVNSLPRKALQHLHNIMARLGRGNTLLMAAKSSSPK